MKKDNVLLIVGNGFDLNMDLKTSYSDFLDSLKTHSLTNDLIRELRIRKKTNWVDIEKELENCAINGLRELNAVSLSSRYKLKHTEYKEIKIFLKSFLLEKQKKTIYNLDEKNSYNLLLGLCADVNNNITILNFNYTDTIDRLYDVILQNRFIDIEDRFKQIHVHGDLTTGIVFGIDDKAKVKKEHVFLHKSFDNNTTKININALLEDQKEIIFFGYSLGISDASYFEDFFKKICLPNNKTSKSSQLKLTFYYYKEEGYIDLFNRLLDLTNHSTAKLRQYNNIKFIDSSINL